jgi:hypothetical protein
MCTSVLGLAEVKNACITNYSTHRLTQLKSQACHFLNCCVFEEGDVTSFYQTAECTLKPSIGISTGTLSSRWCSSTQLTQLVRVVTYNKSVLVRHQFCVSVPTLQYWMLCQYELYHLWYPVKLFLLYTWFAIHVLCLILAQ